MFLNTVTSNLINSGIATFTGLNTRISFVPDVPLFSSDAPSSTSQTVKPKTSQPHSPQHQPQAGSLIAPAHHQHLPKVVQPNAAPKITIKKKAKSPVSPEYAQIEYLTTELNFTQSKIVTQDNTIRDLEHKVKILSDKLKISEEKLNSDLHRKYFGPSSTSCPLLSTPSHCTLCPAHPPPPPAPPPSSCLSAGDCN